MPTKKNRYDKKKAKNKTLPNIEKPNFKLFVILNSPELSKGPIFDSNRLFRPTTLVK